MLTSTIEFILVEGSFFGICIDVNINEVRIRKNLINWLLKRKINFSKLIKSKIKHFDIL
jgi:hypothetical protein